MNKENLLILAKLLERKVEAENFNMRVFLRTGDGLEDFPNVARQKLHDCGTVACALGHAPLIFPPRANEYWMEYGERVFGLVRRSAEWNYCFGSEWASMRGEETPQAAAARIRKVVELGHAPS